MQDVEDLNESYTKEVDYNFITKNEDKDITSDTIAVLNAVYRYLNIEDIELVRLIKCTGKLEEEEIKKFKSVYKSTMEDLIELFSKDKKIKEYIGIK